MSKIYIPQTTLSALKNMLFNSDNGVDVSPIVNDLILLDEEKDLTAINVALLMKGFSPDIDMSPRYRYCYRNEMIRYTPVKYSLIRDEMLVDVCYIKIQDGNWGYNKKQKQVLSGDNFFELSSDYEDALKECEQYVAKK